MEEEIQRLKDRIAVLEAAEAGRSNPDVLLIEGRLTYYEGEYCATGVQTSAGLIYLADAVSNLIGWRDSATICWHLSSERKTYAELEQELAERALGKVECTFLHAYSDLTGYLWTNEAIKIDGHDVLSEIQETARSFNGPVYICLRAERIKK